MSGFGIQEGLAILAVAVAAGWLVRRRFVHRASKSAGCSACAHVGTHGATPTRESAAAAGPTSVSSAAAADPRPSGSGAGSNQRR